MAKASSARRAGGKRDQLVKAIIESAGLGECSQLCDVNQVRYVCDLVPEAFFAAQGGSSYGLVSAIRERLIRPLERYLSTLEMPSERRGIRLEVEPTIQLIAAATEVSRQIEQGPWGDADAERCRALLVSAWHTWIAYVASVWMWSAVPKTIASQQLARVNGAVSDGRPPSVSREQIVTDCERLLKSKESREVASVVAAKIGKSPQWVRRVWNEHRAKKEKTKPGG